MAIKEWLDSQMNLFWFDQSDGSFNYLLSTEVGRIRYLGNDIVRLRLHGLLPSGLHFLKDFNNGDVLLILHKKCGLRENYDPKDVIVTFERCEIKHKWIEKLSVIHCSEERIDFYMTVQGIIVWQNEN